MIGADEDVFFADDALAQRIARQRVPRKSGLDAAKGVLSGALSGAKTGASIGAAGGPEGALIGGAVGAVGGAVGSQLEETSAPKSGRATAGEFLQGKGEYAQLAERTAGLAARGDSAARRVPRKDKFGFEWSDTPDGQESEFGDFEFGDGGVSA